MAQKKDTEKKTTTVRDLAPKKDAKGGAARNPNSASLDGASLNGASLNSKNADGASLNRGTTGSN